mgnify:CR=1 FL=1
MGGRVWDVSGNEYVDYLLGSGPMIVGHAHPEVVGAIQNAAELGVSFGAPTESETWLAEMISRIMPSIEMVRMVNSGTEATMSAVRLARGYTGRDVIVKFAGNYHGHVDSLLVAAGSSAATLSVPNSPGVTAGTSRDTLILEFNDCQALEEAFASHGDQIAGVIMEPIVGNMGCVPSSSEFAHAVRQLTADAGALLIMDEVMTGFRVAYGGAQSLLQIVPDLTTMGKIVGGGMPIGAYGGRADIMDHVLPVGKVFQAGTLSGNPIATAAGSATLRTLRDENPYPQLESQGAKLADGLAAAASAAGLPHQLQRVGSMMTLFFHAGPIDGWEQAANCDTEQFSRYFWGLLDRGVYMPCSQYEALFVSTAHSDEDIEQTIEAAGEVLAGLS